MGKRAAEVLDETWYKDAVIYEVHVRSFFDSTQNGHGDFPGLKSKLDYLQDLGVNALWLLPFYPSPLRDDGYDIADYCDIHKDYGTLADFRALLREAHSRGIRVITELVLNHTSDQHAWFQRARRAKPGSPERDFYVWSDTPEKYAGTRIIFKDFETSNWSWDPVAGAYYWHRFYNHQPDLNFENPQVEAELLRVVDFWLAMGVDGLRLDAVPYLYEREDTNCENLPETIGALKRLRAHVDARFPGRMLLAEANQWPEDAARYFGEGDACHMTFHFPLMPRMFVALEMEDRSPIVDILEQTPEIPEACQWAIFLRNHDELTLEMVSEEERDFMYQVYAHDRRARINLGIRRRLAPLLRNDRRKIELMNVLLMTMPGSPVIYYGDEIGMGDNYYLGDRNGVRTPMQWSPDRNAGFSRVNPQQLYLPAVIDPEYHYQSVNVENQQRNPSSLLWWMKQLIALRRRHRALGRGGMRFLRQDSPKVISYLRTLGEECLLVVANLSRHPQATRLDLSTHAGRTPVEVMGRTRFPVITSAPYPLTIGPHGYYILELRVQSQPHGPDRPYPVLRRQDSGGWRFLDTRLKTTLQGVILPEYLRRRAEEAGTGPQIISTTLHDVLPVGTARAPSWIGVLEVKFAGGGSESRTLLLSFVDAEQARHIAREEPGRYICTLGRPLDEAGAAPALATGKDELEGALVEGAEERRAHAGLLRLFTQRRRIRGRDGEFVVLQGRLGKKIRMLVDQQPESELVPDVSANALIAYGRQALLKIFRRTAEGGNPDLEVVRHLTETVGFKHTPEFLGALQYLRPGHEPVVVAMLRGYVQSESTAWDICATALGLYFHRVLAEEQELPPPRRSATALATAPGAEDALDLAEGMPGHILPDEHSIAVMARIGQRTAQMHLALAQDSEDPAFAPEPFDKTYRRAVYQDVFGKTRRILDRLEQAHPSLPPQEALLAEQVLALREGLADRLRRFRDTPVQGLKTRIHGEYDLRHLLFTGRDFMIVDFEGRTTRSLSARRLKRSPLRDVCDLLSALGHVAEAGLRDHCSIRPEDEQRLRPWAEHWHTRMGGHFLRSYLEAAGQAGFLPQDGADLDLVLTTFLLDQAFFALGRALEHWPGGPEPGWEASNLCGLLRNMLWLLSHRGAQPEEERT
ncbi:MAG: maltose alpha-D-glucosyltransferase [Proteobacteria bacterium]|nr:maltose alpha-D-glucosyltransferase [Pseudomonadota bacterium]MBU1595600.1 maltose alpha-D-glucosyltransferase [Pseudomonadota bacterium]